MQGACQAHAYVKKLGWHWLVPTVPKLRARTSAGKPDAAVAHCRLQVRAALARRPDSAPSLFIPAAYVGRPVMDGLQCLTAANTARVFLKKFATRGRQQPW